MNSQKSWILRGYFDFRDRNGVQTCTQAIRDALSTAVGRQLSIGFFPAGPSLKHTFWWREGDAPFVEAQFILTIDQHCPVLSAGLSVEKGLADPKALSRPESERMDRETWDWQRLIDNLDHVLDSAVHNLELQLSLPLQLKTRVLGACDRKLVLAQSGLRTFSYFEGQWFERHNEPTGSQQIAEYLRDLDEKQDHWVDLYLVVDLDPNSADSMTPGEVANILAAFDRLRKRLRGRS